MDARSWIRDLLKTSTTLGICFPASLHQMTTSGSDCGNRFFAVMTPTVVRTIIGKWATSIF